MKRPGDTLRSLAARVCSATTMERLIDPVIADMQCEHAEAARQGRMWLCCWIQLAGWLAFWRGVAMYSIERLKDGMRECLSRDEAVIGRTLGFITAVTVMVMLLMELPYTIGAGRSIGMGRRLAALAFLHLLPWAFPIAVSVGVLFGTAYGLRGRPITPRVRRATLTIGAGCAVAAFIAMAWIIPVGNRYFRQVYFPDRIMTKESWGPPALTLHELNLKIDELKGRGMGRSYYAQTFVFNYHTRLALSATPLLFGLFALVLSEATRRRRSYAVISLIALAASVAYWALLYASRVALSSLWIPGALWMPNLIFLAATLFLVHRTRQSLETL